MAEKGDDAKVLAKQAAPAVVVGGAAEAIELVTGLPGLAGPLAPALAAVWRGLRAADARMYQQIARAMEAAGEIVGGVEEVERLAVLDPARTELFRRVVEAAARSPIDEKIEALGRVLAQGLRDDAQVDEALVLAAALTDLEPAHVRVLGTIHDQPFAGVVAGPTPGLTGWGMEQLEVHMPGARLVMPALVQVLFGHGLIEDLGQTNDVRYADVGYGGRYRITPLGRRCIALLREPNVAY